MSVLTIIVLIVALGVILWAVNKYIPMEENMKKLLNVVVIVLVVLWLLSLFGILPDLNAIRVGN